MCSDLVAWRLPSKGREPFAVNSSRALLYCVRRFLCSFFHALADVFCALFNLFPRFFANTLAHSRPRLGCLLRAPSRFCGCFICGTSAVFHSRFGSATGILSRFLRSFAGVLRSLVSLRIEGCQKTSTGANGVRKLREASRNIGDAVAARGTPRQSAQAFAWVPPPTHGECSGRSGWRAEADTTTSY